MASKDYLCKDCDNNNNGWCPIKKCQGLKSITECSSKVVNGIIVNCGIPTLKVVATKDVPPVVIPEPKMVHIHDLFPEDKNTTHAAHKQFGKREMLYVIQTQMLAIDKDVKEEDKFKELKKVLVNLESMLAIEEHLYGIALDYEIDKGIYEGTKNVLKTWFKEVGPYEGK